jgi:carbonic anhydrase
MKRLIFPIGIAVGFTALLLSCHSLSDTNSKGSPENDSTSFSYTQKPPKTVLTAAEQHALTPDGIIVSLKEGNKRFVSSGITARDHSAIVRNALLSQHPEAVILSCLDSRVLVEDIFDARIGDLFVARVAGNIADEDILGSLEYGCAEAGAKLVVVLGHESCGAVKAAIEDVHLGNITAMLSKIKPALLQSKDFTGGKTAENETYVEYVVKNNVRNTIETVMAKSPVLKAMADKGEIKIVGAYYDLKTGEVRFL